MKCGLALEWLFGGRARTTMDMYATLTEQVSALRLRDELWKAASRDPDFNSVSTASLT